MGGVYRLHMKSTYRNQWPNCIPTETIVLGWYKYTSWGEKYRILILYPIGPRSSLIYLYASYTPNYRKPLFPHRDFHLLYMASMCMRKRIVEAWAGHIRRKVSLGAMVESGCILPHSLLTSIKKLYLVLMWWSLCFNSCYDLIMYDLMFYIYMLIWSNIHILNMLWTIANI